MKIYTKTGDRGETSLVDGARVKKSHPRVDAYGTVDELNSILGLCVATATLDPELSTQFDFPHFQKIQNSLFNLGSLLACGSEKVKLRLPRLEPSEIEEMEAKIDKMNEALPPLKEFILPGGNLVASFLHQARTVCRRAERKVVEIEDTEELMVQYLNRLSDYLFVAARFANFKANSKEITWKK